MTIKAYLLLATVSHFLRNGPLKVVWDRDFKVKNGGMAGFAGEKMGWKAGFKNPVAALPI